MYRGRVSGVWVLPRWWVLLAGVGTHPCQLGTDIHMRKHYLLGTSSAGSKISSKVADDEADCPKVIDELRKIFV